MVFTIKYSSDEFFDKALNNAMEELNNFFDINWSRNMPGIIIAQNRKAMNRLMGFETKDWMVGFTSGKNIVLLSRESYDTESCHDYSELEYIKLLKHELVHLFLEIYVQEGFIPKWLDEGTAIYLSRQLKKDQIKKFTCFLNNNHHKDNPFYQESENIVEILIKKFGREKFLNLLRSLNKLSSQEEFVNRFRKIYEFIPSYEKFNNIRKIAKK